MGRQIILEIDDVTARELEAVAPSRDRRRSDFIRRALRAALDRVAEARMREAYSRQPDGPGVFDPAVWEPARPRGRRARRSR